MAWSIMAAKEQKKGLKKAQNVVWDMYEKSRADLAPAREAGEWAMNRALEMLKSGPPKYEQTPEYTASFNSGVRALKEGAAATGNLDSSAFNEDLYRFGKNEALNDVDRFYNRWLTTRWGPTVQLAGLGAQAGTIPTVQLNQQTSDSLANIKVSQGNARAGMWNGIGSALMNTAALGVGAYGAGMFGGGAAAGAGAGLASNSPYGSMFAGTGGMPWYK